MPIECMQGMTKGALHARKDEKKCRPIKKRSDRARGVCVPGRSESSKALHAQLAWQRVRRLGRRRKALIPMPVESSDEEEMDGGTISAPPVAPEPAAATSAAAGSDSEEEDIDGGSLTSAAAPDLFGPDSADYNSATVQSEWLPPARQHGRVICMKRGAPGGTGGHAGGLVPPPPPKRPAPPANSAAAAAVAAALRKKPMFVAATASDAEIVASAASDGSAGGTGAVKSEFAASELAPPPPPAQGPPPSSAAGRMMAKMGYREGGGLGKDEQGMASAVVEAGNVGFLGLGFQGAKSAADDDVSLPPLPKVAAPLSQPELDPCPLPDWMAPCEVAPPDRATLQNWLVEGKRVESVDDETEHIEPRILKLILRAKTQFDHITDRRAFNDARTRANPFEAIKKEFFMNRAALKMAAMDAAFELMFSGADAPDPKAFAQESLASAVAAFTESHTSATCSVPRPAPSVLYFGDVAAGPGGFSEYILWRRGVSAKGFGFTLRNENDFELGKFHHRAAPELFHAYYGPTNDGDLYNSDNIRALRELVRRQTHGQMLHVMMGDGGFDVSGLENIQEVMNKQLLLAQCVSALACLREGGHFVTKAFDLFTPFSAGLLYLLHTTFDAVCIYKPAQSRPANSERYLVCKGFRGGAEDIVEHLLSVNTRLNELKTDWPCGGRVGAAGDGGGGSGLGPPGLDVLRLVPASVLQSGAFGRYLRESNDRIGALQATALERLIVYMTYDRGGRICDQAATRDECLRAWALPPELPPPPPAHPNVELFYQIEIEKGDRFERNLLSNHQAAELTAEDLTVSSGNSRLRTMGDWVVVEANSDLPPCLVVGADGDGHRGVACAFDPRTGVWRLLHGVRLPAATLLLAEVVWETPAGADGTGADVGGGAGAVECVHVMDAAMICGDDVRRLPYAERSRRAEFMVEALRSDGWERLAEVQKEQGKAADPVQDAWAAVDATVGRRKKGGAAKAAAAAAAATTAKPETQALVPSAAPDYMRVRMKRFFKLHDLAEALVTGGGQGGPSTWPLFGLLLFPGHASPQLPLEPPNEWKKEWSSSQQRSYWYNKRTEQSVWDSQRKTRPISFRSCAAAMLRWDRRSTALPEEKVLELAASIPPPPS